MSTQSGPPILQVSDAVDEAIADVVDFLPTVAAAIVILVVGYIVGRILGAVVTSLVRRVGVDRYAEGTAVEGVGGRDAVARGLGKIVAFYVYFVAILAAADVLDIPQLTDLLSELGGYIPVVLGALVVLVVGFLIGRIVGDVVASVVGGLGVGSFLRGTPLETLGDQKGEFGRIVGQVVAYYVYLLTLLAVADILAIGELSELLNGFAAYIPSLVGGLLILLVGIWLAERVGDMVAESDESRMAQVAAVGVKVLIYYLTITIALSAIGFRIGVLTDLFQVAVVAFFGAIGLALAIGAGIAIGLGGQDYVAENIGNWMGTARETVGEETAGGESGDEGAADEESD